MTRSRSNANNADLPPPTCLVGYTRVSTLEQSRVGVSLEAQQERIEAYAKFQSLRVLSVHTDEGISGRQTRRRPSLERAITETCEHRAVLCVYSLSRLARSTKHALEISERIKDAGAQLALITEQIDTGTAAGKMFYTVLAAIATFESDQLSERVRLALRYKRERGHRYSKEVPYGSRAGSSGRIETDPDEQRVLAEIRRLRADGHTLRGIAEALDEQGLRNRADKPFSFQRIAALIQRERTGQKQAIAS